MSYEEVRADFKKARELAFGAGKALSVPEALAFKVRFQSVEGGDPSELALCMTNIDKIIQSKPPLDVHDSDEDEDPTTLSSSESDAAVATHVSDNVIDVDDVDVSFRGSKLPLDGESEDNDNDSDDDLPEMTELLQMMALPPGHVYPFPEERVDEVIQHIVAEGICTLVKVQGTQGDLVPNIHVRIPMDGGCLLGSILIAEFGIPVTPPPTHTLSDRATRRHLYVIVPLSCSAW
jgi:hypothetical protein